MSELFEVQVAHEMSGRLINKKAIQDFIFAGKAIFTVKNDLTGNRFTYKITQSKYRKDKFYISNLRGPNIYAKMGLISGADKKYQLPLNWKEKEKWAESNFAILYPGQPFPFTEYRKKNMPQSLRVFMWFLEKYKSNKEFEKNIEVWHEGVCGRCGRKLTVPTSIDLGFGPECIKRVK